MPTATLERPRQATTRSRRQTTAGQIAAVFCAHCGNSQPTEGALDWVRLGDAAYCSEECAIAAGHDRCAHCGAIYDPALRGIAIGDDRYCCPECAEASGYHRCPSCHAWHTSEQEGAVVAFGQVVHTEHHFCSPGCAAVARAFRCESCGDWHMGNANSTPTGFICEECAEDHYVYCSNCGFFVDDDDWSDEYDCCDSCAERYDGGEHLHRYGFRPTVKFFGDTEDNRYPYLGVELETDTTETDARGAGQRRRDYCECLAKLETKPRFWMTQDGSLFCGVEVTSHPMTLTEHMECGLWESVREKALQYGFSSHDNGRCGLHVHVNRSFFGKSEKRQQVGGYNLAMLVSRFEKQLTQFSRRQDNRWCSYGIHSAYMDKSNPSMREMDMFAKSERLCGESLVHAQCVNFQHSATFELRIFRGTLRLETLYASLAMTQGLARAAKHHSQTWCEGVSWADLTQYILADMDNEEARTALAQYLTERGVG